MAPALSVKRLVLDSNVVLALWRYADPALAPLRRFCESDAVTLLGSEACLVELSRVLQYPALKLEPEQAADLLTHYGQRITLVPRSLSPAFPLPACKDQDDQKFLELARDGQGEYLLTRDKALLKLARRKTLLGHFTILTPESFITRILTPTGTSKAVGEDTCYAGG